jgi:hypothetical protein
MARKPRVEFAGAFYHVIVRGNQRQNIFRDDKDRLAYLERMPWVPILPNPTIGISLFLFGYPGTIRSGVVLAGLCEKISQYTHA